MKDERESKIRLKKKGGGGGGVVVRQFHDPSVLSPCEVKPASPGSAVRSIMEGWLEGRVRTLSDFCDRSNSTLIVPSALPSSEGQDASVSSDPSLCIKVPSARFPRMNVRIPVRVARGILGSFPSVSSPSRFLPTAILEFSTRFLNDGFSGGLLAPLDRWATNRERKAVSDTMMTAMQASISCQNISHVTSMVLVGAWMPDI